MKRFFSILGVSILSFAVFLVVGYGLLVLLTHPSNDRDWSLDQAVLPYAEISGDLVTIYNIRNFTYRSTTDYTPGYYDATYDLSRLVRVYYIVEPFSGYRGAAHTLLSFEFDVPGEGSKFLAVSVEVRKEKGEVFKALKGMLRQFEIMYVVADERDVLGLRANHRHDDVYVYPVMAEQESVQNMFLQVIDSMNTLKEHPAFYNTITRNCIMEIVRNVHALSPGRIPWQKTLLFPKESDRYAYDLGFLDTSVPFEELRATHKINDLAEQYAEDADFSLKIRGR